MDSEIKRLVLGVDDLENSHKAKPPEHPRFYHFKVSAKEFHEAHEILFVMEGRKDYIIKDNYGRLNKKQDDDRKLQGSP